MIRAVLVTLLVGMALGWIARTHTADHRYITALASRMVAEARYYNTKNDALIEANKKEMKRGNTGSY
jgi:hypothetical protein